MSIAGNNTFTNVVTQAAYQGELNVGTLNAVAGVDAGAVSVGGGHLTTSGAAPVAATTVGTVTLAPGSNDTAGAFIVAGTLTTNAVLKLTFSKAFTKAPTVVLTAGNVAAALCEHYVSTTPSENLVNFKATNAAASAANPVLNYLVVG